MKRLSPLLALPFLVACGQADDARTCALWDIAQIDTATAFKELRLKPADIPEEKDPQFESVFQYCKTRIDVTTPYN